MIHNGSLPGGTKQGLYENFGRNQKITSNQRYLYPQRRKRLSFVQNDKVHQKHYDEIIILLGTGLRISELCGLIETDIDFEYKLINADHQLLKASGVGYYVETPKTKSGIRRPPISAKVYEAFKRTLSDKGQTDKPAPALK